MIINKKNTIHRARPSGKTVCATLAAAGLISLAAAVTPAFAQTVIPGSGVITSGGSYYGNHAGNVDISYTESAGYWTADQAPFVINLILTDVIGTGVASSVTGDFNLGNNNRYGSTNGSSSGNYSRYNDINVTFSSDFSIGGSLTATGNAANKRVTVGSGSILSVGQDIATGFTSFTVAGTNAKGRTTDLVVGGNIAQNITISGSSRVALSVGGNVTGTITGAIQELSVAAGKTTTLITVSSQSDPGKITSVNGTDSLTLGSTGTRTTIIVGANNFDINTGGAGGLTFVEQLKSGTGGTLNEVNFAGNGNLTIETTGTGNIAFNNGINFNDTKANAYTGTLTIDSGGAINTGAATTIVTKGDVDLDAVGALSTVGGTTISTAKNITIDAASALLGGTTALTAADVRMNINGDITGGSITETGVTYAELVSKTGKIALTGNLAVSATDPTNGDVKVSAEKGISAANITVTGSDVVSVTNTGSGNIATAGTLKVAGKTGAVTVANYGGDITAKAADFDSTTGDIKVDASGSLKTTGGDLTADTTTGKITLAAGNDIDVTGDLKLGAAATHTAGDIALTAGADGKINVTGVTTIGTAGNAGNISLNAGIGGINFAGGATLNNTGTGNNIAVTTTGALTGALTATSGGGKVTVDVLSWAGANLILSGQDDTGLVAKGNIATAAAGKIDIKSTTGKAYVSADPTGNISAGTGGIKVDGATLAQINAANGKVSSGGKIEAIASAGDAQIVGKTGIDAAGDLTADAGGAGSILVSADTGQIKAGGNMKLDTDGGNITVTAGPDGTTDPAIKVAGTTDITSTGGNVSIKAGGGMNFGNTTTINVLDGTSKGTASTSIASSTGDISFKSGKTADAFNYKGYDGDLSIAAADGGVFFKGDNTIEQGRNGSVSISGANGGKVEFTGANDIKMRVSLKE